MAAPKVRPKTKAEAAGISEQLDDGSAPIGLLPAEEQELLRLKRNARAMALSVDEQHQEILRTLEGSQDHVEFSIFSRRFPTPDAFAAIDEPTRARLIESLFQTLQDGFYRAFLTILRDKILKEDWDWLAELEAEDKIRRTGKFRELHSKLFTKAERGEVHGEPCIAALQRLKRLEAEEPVQMAR